MNMHAVPTVLAQSIAAPSYAAGATADVKGFRVNVPYNEAVAAHEAAKAAVDAMDNSSERIDEAVAQTLIAVERNSRRAVMLAYCADLKEAAARVVYFQKYWNDLGEGAGEAENAWPELTHVIYHLSVQIDYPSDSDTASECDFAAAQFEPCPPLVDPNESLSDKRMNEIGTTVRVAYQIACKTRSELVGCMSEQGAEKHFGDLCNTIDETRTAIQGMSELLDAAQARIFIADAAARACVLPSS